MRKAAAVCDSLAVAAALVKCDSHAEIHATHYRLDTSTWLPEFGGRVRQLAARRDSDSFRTSGTCRHARHRARARDPALRKLSAGGRLRANDGRSLPPRPEPGREQGLFLSALERP